MSPVPSNFLRVWPDGTRQCPRCGRTIQVSSLDFDTYLCIRCHARYLKKYAESMEGTPPTPERVTNRNVLKLWPDGTRQCPRCGRTVRILGRDSKIYRCGKCNARYHLKYAESMEGTPPTPERVTNRNVLKLWPDGTRQCAVCGNAVRYLPYAEPSHYDCRKCGAIHWKASYARMSGEPPFTNRVVYSRPRTPSTLRVWPDGIVQCPNCEWISKRSPDSRDGETYACGQCGKVYRWVYAKSMRGPSPSVPENSVPAGPSRDSADSLCAYCSRCEVWIKTVSRQTRRVRCPICELNVSIRLGRTLPYSACVVRDFPIVAGLPVSSGRSEA